MTSPDPITILHTAASRMERAAAAARAIAEQLTVGAAEARCAYETALRTVDGSDSGKDPCGT
jgi:hypothetical protein